MNLELGQPLTILLDRFEESKKRMVAQPTSSIHAERYEKRMPVGSYQLRLNHRNTTRWFTPSNLTMGQTGTAANLEPLSQQTSLTLPPQRAKLVLVIWFMPEGWFYVGGDPEAPNSLGEKRVWADGFVISETPITHGQYLNFLNDLVARSEGASEAELWLPREQSSSEEAKGEALYTWDGTELQPPAG